MPPTRGSEAVNRLIEALPRGERTSLLAECETVKLVFSDVLQTPGERLTDVFFPTTGFISMILPLDETACLEVGLVGDEGMFGIPSVLGVEVSSVRAVVQGAGAALKISAASFRRELVRSKILRRDMDRYIFVQMSQLARMAACARYHVVEARLARWLLMTQDRAQSDTFRMTHEFLAFMLGVRRVGVTRAASSLQTRGLIHYSRGNITVLDRPGLAGASCGCYASDCEAYERILG